MEKVWQRHERMAAAARAAATGLNLKLFARVNPTSGLTVFEVPEGLDASVILSRLEKEHGIRIAGGQDTMKGKIVRLAHMGYIDFFEVLAAVSALELVLSDMGHKIESGAGVSAAQRAFASWKPGA
jgi:aspartate aminotransferase-like enzyme